MRRTKAVLDGEPEVIAQGETARSSLTPSDDRLQANGIDTDGLANVLVSPRRKERVLVFGMMALADGTLVRLQGRLAKSPSFCRGRSWDARYRRVQFARLSAGPTL